MLHVLYVLMSYKRCHNDVMNPLLLTVDRKLPQSHLSTGKTTYTLAEKIGTCFYSTLVYLHHERHRNKILFQRKPSSLFRETKPVLAHEACLNFDLPHPPTYVNIPSIVVVYFCSYNFLSGIYIPNELRPSCTQHTHNTHTHTHIHTHVNFVACTGTHLFLLLVQALLALFLWRSSEEGGGKGRAYVRVCVCVFVCIASSWRNIPEIHSLVPQSFFIL